MSPATRSRLTILGISVALIAVGVLVIGSALLNRASSVAQVQKQSAADIASLNSWLPNGGSAVKPDSATGTCSPGGAPDSQYALLQFSSLTQYNYAGVAGDGTWDLLHERSMVHYTGTPGPGQRGNSIIAFHREPNYEHIDALDKGGTVTIQDRQCHVYVYTVSQRWELHPEQVTQLVPTSGYDLTLVTCTPFWQDFDRYVWRASLTSVDGKAFVAPTA